MRIAFVVLLFLNFPQPSVIDQIAQSGRCATLAQTPDARVSGGLLIAPGQPPLLSFRTYEGKLRGRFAGSDLMLDDAGH